MTDGQHSLLSLSPEEALFEGKIQGLILTSYKKERPPMGLLGILDWYFYGGISHFVRQGTITGEIGECVYLPIEKKAILYHLFIMGAGKNTSPGARAPVPPSALYLLKKNLISLQIQSLAVSKNDFGQVNLDYFNQHLKGVSLYITP